MYFPPRSYPQCLRWIPSGALVGELAEEAYASFAYAVHKLRRKRGHNFPWIAMLTLD